MNKQFSQFTTSESGEGKQIRRFSVAQKVIIGIEVLKVLWNRSASSQNWRSRSSSSSLISPDQWIDCQALRLTKLRVEMVTCVLTHLWLSHRISVNTSTGTWSKICQEMRQPDKATHLPMAIFHFLAGWKQWCVSFVESKQASPIAEVSVFVEIRQFKLASWSFLVARWKQLQQSLWTGKTKVWEQASVQIVLRSGPLFRSDSNPPTQFDLPTCPTYIQPIPPHVPTSMPYFPIENVAFQVQFGPQAKLQCNVSWFNFLISWALPNELLEFPAAGGHSPQPFPSRGIWADGRTRLVGMSNPCWQNFDAWHIQVYTRRLWNSISTKLPLLTHPAHAPHPLGLSTWSDLHSLFSHWERGPSSPIRPQCGNSRCIASGLLSGASRISQNIRPNMAHDRGMPGDCPLCMHTLYY